MPYGLDSLETFQMANECNQCLLHIGVSIEGVEPSPKVLATLGGSTIKGQKKVTAMEIRCHNDKKDLSPSWGPSLLLGTTLTTWQAEETYSHKVFRCQHTHQFWYPMFKHAMSWKLFRAVHLQTVKFPNNVTTFSWDSRKSGSSSLPSSNGKHLQ